MRELSFFSLLACLGLLAGCGNLTINFTQTTSPQFWAVENKTQAQYNQIQAAVSANQIPFTIGDGLSENDETIRRLNHRFRDQSNGATDLSPAQYALLTRFIQDNQKALDDAVANPDDWQDSFAAQDAALQRHREPFGLDFTHYLQRARFIVYLNMRLKEDAAKALAMAQSGQVGMEQAQDLRSNLDNVRNKAVEDYYDNGRLDLNADQIFQLRRMLVDSYQALNPPAPAYGAGGFPSNAFNPPAGNWANNYPNSASGYQYYNSPAKGSSSGSNPVKGTVGKPSPTATVVKSPVPPRSRLFGNYPGGNRKIPAAPTPTSAPSGASVPSGAPAPTDTPIPAPAAPTPMPTPVPASPNSPGPADNATPTDNSGQNHGNRGHGNNDGSNAGTHPGNHFGNNGMTGHFGGSNGEASSDNPSAQASPTPDTDDATPAPIPGN
ncbi:MAG TPA: hypothetical protein VMU88_07925 [bacterium]|nr:hypothetical protein [bacterium]